MASVIVAAAAAAADFFYNACHIPSAHLCTRNTHTCKWCGKKEQKKPYFNIYYFLLLPFQYRGRRKKEVVLGRLEMFMELGFFFKKKPLTI